MTLTMADAIDPNALPAGYDAYAGYVNGRWNDFNAIVARFPNAHHLSIDVLNAGVADCLDIEQGDATPADAPGWVDTRTAAGVTRPCLYASISTMNQVVAALGNRPRSTYRLWSAHYGAGTHICGPTTCNYGGNAPQCDGTQWNSLSTPNIDESILSDDFFGGPVTPPPNPYRQSQDVPLPGKIVAVDWVYVGPDEATQKPSFHVLCRNDAGELWHKWWMPGVGFTIEKF